MSVKADASDRLIRTFGIVVNRAPAGLMTYGEFADQLGIAAQGTGPFLTPLLRWCRLNGLPPLPIIVVEKATGRPAGGDYDAATMDAETERVRKHDWSAVTKPTHDELLSLRRAPDFAAR